jgi:hypothetical protein
MKNKSNGNNLGSKSSASGPPESGKMTQTGSSTGPLLESVIPGAFGTSPVVCSPGNTSPAIDFDELQNLETSLFTFPDDRELDMPVMKVMRAGLSIATALSCADTIWDPTFSHVLDAGMIDYASLPANIYPITAQLLVPHHPLLDILPWPSVRQKLIQVFASPLHERPPAARDPLAIMCMLYDIDDESEGFRIEGDVGVDEKAWIVGQKFFSNWWWALDRSIVARANESRSSRGQPRLTPINDAC